MGLADLEFAIGHHLPQISDRIGISIFNRLHHPLMETRFRQPEVAGVAELQTIRRTLED